jgi:hypothetical protein
MTNGALANAKYQNLKRKKWHKRQLNVLGRNIDFTNKKSLEKIISNDKKGESKARIYLLLGATLGNFEQKTQDRIIKNISKVMNYQDRLIISVNGINDQRWGPKKYWEFIEKWKDKHCPHSSDGYFPDFINQYKASEEFIYKPLEILGIPKENLGEYRVDISNFRLNYLIDCMAGKPHYTQALPRYSIVASFPVIKNTKVSYNNQKLTLKVGDLIDVAVSERFSALSLLCLCMPNKLIASKHDSILGDYTKIIGVFRKVQGDCYRWLWGVKTKVKRRKFNYNEEVRYNLKKEGDDKDLPSMITKMYPFDKPIDHTKRNNTGKNTFSRLVKQKILLDVYVRKKL